VPEKVKAVVQIVKRDIDPDILELRKKEFVYSNKFNPKEPKTFERKLLHVNL
jgi:hypothetical protein